MTTVGRSVLAVPPMVLVAPVNVTAFAPPLRAPPLFVKFPATVTLPASVTNTPGLIWIFPKVTGAVGVMIDALVKVTLLVALNVSAVVPAVRFPPTLMFVAATVDNAGVFAPPNVNPPLKFIVPAPVAESVPELSVNALLKVIVPVVRLITSLAAFVLEAYVTEPDTVNAPVVTAIRETRDGVIFDPPIKISLFTIAYPVLMFQETVTAAVGWLIETLVITVKLFSPVCVSAFANPIEVNVRELTVADGTSRVTVTAGPGRAVFPITTSSEAVGNACRPYA
jgi:hypothetical protein